MSTETDRLPNRIRQVSNKIAEKSIQVNGCVPLAEIEAFESQYQITLPEDYRQFLIEIGNGGDGPPNYGLKSLAETVISEDGRKLRPDQPFPLTELWVWEDEIGWENGEPEELDPVFLHGHLYLGTEGDGQDWILIVTGSERGKVWQRADVGALPCNPERDFLSWYEYWLDGNDDWWQG